MSFILDALKKSENDRQRQSGPALFEVRVAPPRSKFPLLAVVIVALLVVNLGVVGWVMMRKPAAAAVPPAPTAAAPAPAAATPAPAAAPPTFNAQQNPPAVAPAPPQGYTQGPPQGVPPPAQQLAYNGAPPSAAASGAAPASNGYAPNGYAPPPANNAYPQPNTAGPTYYNGARNQDPNLAEQNPPSSGQQQLNPDDYAPARDAPPPGTGAGRVIRSTDTGLPTYEEAATHASIPPLHMDLHSYAADPTKRFVMINMKMLYEGQSLPEGPKVERITSDSAVMSYRGTQFVLERD
jgi:hypothetical protein